jgi:hypothetical protein
MERQGISHLFPKYIQELMVFRRYSRVNFLGFGIETQLKLYCFQAFMLFSEQLPWSYILRIYISQACCFLALFRVRSYSVIAFDVYFLCNSFSAISFAIRVAEPSIATT